MLKYLRVTNFSILSDVTVEFGDGLNVLTGETGAGKSLIVEAVNLLRGGRASADIPRTGADEAVVEAIVDVPADLKALVAARLLDAGLPEEEDVSIRRVIQRGGKSRVYVNGALTTASRLADLGAILIDLSGQHQHQGLVNAANHRSILDAFGALRDKRLGLLTAQYHDAWQQNLALAAQLAELETDESARVARLEVARFLFDELEQARLAVGEDVLLETERVRLASADQLLASARHAEQALYSEEESAADKLAVAVREMERITRLDTTLAPAANSLAEAKALIEDAARELRSYANGLDADPARLAEVQERLALMRRLSRKHGCDLSGLVAKHAELEAELAGETNRDAKLAELRTARNAATAACAQLATELSAHRKKAAAALTKAVSAALVELGMSTGAICVHVAECPIGPHGTDHVEFLLSANKGEEARPLAKVASGGELSRIMLALKLILRRADTVATYVFDEVDAGIGGVTAGAVGKQIAAVATDRQVLCVTHLPQIAAFADHHFHVSKTEADGRTETHVTSLRAAERKAELARMLSGSTSAKALAHAAELLGESKSAKSRPSA